MRMRSQVVAVLWALAVGAAHAAGAPSPVTPPDEIATTAFFEGQEARISYERWFASLPDGAYKNGATFWAGNRSLRPPPSCEKHDGSADWHVGCLASRERLATVDIRRLAEKDYRRGWNSLPEQATETAHSSAVNGTAPPLVTSAESTASKQTDGNDRFHSAVQREAACFTKAYRPSEDLSRDGGKSTMRLLSECSDEWDAASQACQANTQAADKVGSCNFSTAIIAQVFLFMQEGRPLPPELSGIYVPPAMNTFRPEAKKAEAHGTPRDPNFAHFMELAGGAAATGEQADALAEIVRQSNYRCDTISAATRWLFSEGFTLRCNALRYEYDIADKGGHWVVTVK